MAVEVVATLARRLKGRLRWEAQWRCAEPVVVFESDDWGLARKAASEYLKGIGEPGEWADEETETVADLDALFKVLHSHRDSTGRPACFTANFVLSNPDFDAILKDKYERYHWLRIGEGESEGLRRRWMAGYEGKVFCPQHHALFHFWPESWLKDLRNDVPGARALFSKRIPGGLSLLKGEGWRYHTEYLDWHSAHPPSDEDLETFIDSSFAEFESLFGFRSESTVAPHYIFTPSVERNWERVGVKYVQAAGYHISRDDDGGKRVKSHRMGERSDSGLQYMARTVKFDPRPQRPSFHVGSAFNQARQFLESGVPVVVDTHRINYTGAWGRTCCTQLNDLLNACKTYRPLYLTSTELAQAVMHDGHFTDAWSGEDRQLTVRTSSRSRLAHLLAHTSLSR